jgi:hypothetical protein
LGYWRRELLEGTDRLARGWASILIAPAIFFIGHGNEYYVRSAYQSTGACTS